jgi:hypothetical protein
MAWRDFFGPILFASLTSALLLAHGIVGSRCASNLAQIAGGLGGGSERSKRFIDSEKREIAKYRSDIVAEFCFTISFITILGSS